MDLIQIHNLKNEKLNRKSKYNCKWRKCMKKLDLAKVKVSEEMVQDVSEFASDMIEKKKNLEGVFYWAEGGIGSILQLRFVYVLDCGLVSFQVDSESSHQKKINRLEEKHNIMISEEECYYQTFVDNKELGIYSYDYPIEEMLQVGEIIYDRNGRLAELKEDIMQNDNIGTDRGRACCQIEPPITYTKKK